MGSTFHQLCPRYSGTLTPTAPTAIRLWETYTFYLSNKDKNCSYVVFELSSFAEIMNEGNNLKNIYNP